MAVLPVNLLMEMGAGLLHLFFPRCCAVCSRSLQGGEEWICLDCELELPETNYHKTKEHALSRHFWGRVQLEGVWSKWYLEGPGPVRQLVHQIKYKGRPDLGEALGRIYGNELREAGKLDDLDALISIPMESIKQRRRGFNQAEIIARGLAVASGLPLECSFLKRVPGGLTQTRKDRFERWDSVKQLYRLQHPHAVEGKHVLLVDDVITTGATIEACASLLLEAGARVSAVALASVE